MPARRQFRGHGNNGGLVTKSRLATPWTVAHQAPPSMGFPRQEYWSGLPCPSPGDLPNPGIKPMSFASQANLTTEPSGKPQVADYVVSNLTPLEVLGAALC